MKRAALLVLAASAALAWADAPRGRYTVSAQTVRDRSTGLTWQISSAPPVRAAEAQTFCAALQLEGAGGFRVPTIKELQTLFDEQRVSPAADPLLRLPPTAVLWSSTVPVGRAGFHWVFEFSPGLLAFGDDTQPLEVRCVRP